MSGFLYVVINGLIVVVVLAISYDSGPLVRIEGGKEGGGNFAGTTGKQPRTRTRTTTRTIS
jgi:hypothetical protein